VRRIGRVPDEDVEGLLALAEVVAVPSRYEGFGLPVLEAMAAGVPVIAADATALPEVVGNAGVLLPPGDVSAWAEALQSLLAEPAERRRWGAAGRGRAAAFTPAANAAAFAALYREALDPT
jgi:alpha-1,3-rhamnosyl/mannosyltransferase